MLSLSISLKSGFWDGEGPERRFWPACNYPATEKRIVEANGIRFWVETEGEGSPLVLIHGGPGIDHRVFHPTISSLAQNHKLIYYDLRGHYMSSEPDDPNAYGLEQDAQDLEALWRALGLEAWDVLGFSYGGAVALKVCNSLPKASAPSHRLLDAGGDDHRRVPATLKGSPALPSDCPSQDTRGAAGARLEILLSQASFARVCF